MFGLWLLFLTSSIEAAPSRAPWVSPSAPVDSGLGATCATFDVQVPFTTTAVQVNISAPATKQEVDATVGGLLGGMINPVASMNPITEDYRIKAKLCCPTQGTDASKSQAVQLLLHALGYTKEFWQFPYQVCILMFSASGYSLQASHPAGDVLISGCSGKEREVGYCSFTFDRLGYGQSERPDPLNNVQLGVHVEIVHQLISKLRDGSISQLSGLSNVPQSFSKIFSVGHSFGGVITNGLLATYPDDVDVVTLTSYSHQVSPDFVPKFNLDNAALLNPKLANYKNGYFTSRTKEDIATAFYFLGNYDPEILKVDKDTQGITALGEIITFASALVEAPNFKNDIAYFTGNNDVGFCPSDSNCGGNATDSVPNMESKYFPNARSFVASTFPDTGHTTFLHLNAQTVQSTFLDYFDQFI
ncbi:hypothetical protein BT69DRAFT_1339549 [Atractiella rhizophila]|nr:hypothetical protein BT69DRAFT_1339549 [Atractiella rhizophila]